MGSGSAAVAPPAELLSRELEFCGRVGTGGAAALAFAAAFLLCRLRASFRYFENRFGEFG